MTAVLTTRMSAIAMREGGDAVGRQLGKSGVTGLAAGPHWYVEIQYDDTLVDPRWNLLFC